MPTRVINCPCGARIESHDDATLAETIRAHNQAAHPAFDLNDAQMAKFVDAARRTAPWDGSTIVAENIEIAPLTPGRAEDFLAFFDNGAFADNPGWASCYCMAYTYHGAADAWESRSGDENRREKEADIRSGRARGYLAYADGAPAAWCNATPRTELPGLDRVPAFRTDDAEQVGAIVCFNVSPRHRRQGIASKLLDAACDGFREQGLAFVEAYPPKDAQGDARSYHGPLDMYLRAGFTPFRDEEHYVVVRKAL
jgi:ribosomal protein S18 acetylase RimI-like enzyme